MPTNDKAFPVIVDGVVVEPGDHYDDHPQPPAAADVETPTVRPTNRHGVARWAEYAEAIGVDADDLAVAVEHQDVEHVRLLVEEHEIEHGVA